jgi:hypothetical protein
MITGDQQAAGAAQWSLRIAFSSEKQTYYLGSEGAF